ncbi:PRC-barrel domain-containing protein [Nucisporomicrobium flavum]|uniref:PRC-barrel domain-containing protein n=1 Tax=Nucisporomicrobium flavum TaxID=2785915 RepID=UPI0035578D86
MAPESTTALIKLSDSDKILADPADDIRGRPVRDPHSDDLGTVEDLLIDDGEDKVRFLRVEHVGSSASARPHPSFRSTRSGRSRTTPSPWVNRGSGWRVPALRPLTDRRR